MGYRLGDSGTYIFLKNRPYLFFDSVKHNDITHSGDEKHFKYHKNKLITINELFEMEKKPKCIVLGEEHKKDLKPIELLGCLTESCKDVNFSQFKPGGFIDPSTYKSLILYPKVKGYDFDLIKGIDYGDEEILLLGHWNDGFV